VTDLFCAEKEICPDSLLWLIGKEPGSERANGVLRGFALPADAVFESVLEAVLR